MIGSVVAHVALLVASSRSAGARPMAAAEPSRPLHSSGAFLLHAEPIHWMCEWPPSPALRACFNEAVLYPGSPGGNPGIEMFGDKLSPSRSWERYDGPESPWPEGDELRASLFMEGARECARIAGSTGWSGGGRVFVRVTRESKERTLVQALPLDAEADDPGLLCCLRESQEMLAGRMKVGRTLRYTFRQSAAGVELTPAPL